MHTHFWHTEISRGQFLRASAGTAATVFTSGLWLPGVVQAAGNDAGAEPRPIVGGIQPFGKGTPVFHVFLPEAGVEPITITDFDGLVGLAIVRGTGKATDTVSGKVSNLLFDTDMRFMQGSYLGMDGAKRTGTFAFV